MSAAQKEEQSHLRFNSSNIAYPSRSLDFLDQLKSTTNGHAAGESRELDILVVGAGLGGLSTAVALSLHGHKVRVLEQAREIEEVGAGIQIPSNSTRLLHRWGVDKYFEGRVVEPSSITFRRWQDGKAIALTPLVPDFQVKYQAPYLVIHRAHFHDALHQRAKELGVELLTDCRVETYDHDAPSVTLTDGRVFTADLIVAADGIRSVARKSLGVEDGAFKTGFAAYRATVDTNKLKDDPELAWLLEGSSLNLWIGEGQHVMSYCISSGSLFNMVLSHVDWTDPQTWTPQTAIEDMRRYFQNWDPRLVKIINMINKTMKWPLMSMGPCKKWVAKSGKMTMLGDAAHAMVPYMSQGAAMAVEDAAGLAIALAHACAPKPKTTIAEALEIFESVRSLRSCQMQQASLVNGKLWHLGDGPEQEARDAATRAELAGEKFETSANQWSDPITQAWTYGYDAEAEIDKAFQERALWEKASR